MQIDPYVRAILRGHYGLYYFIFLPVFALTACCSIWLLRKRLPMSGQAIVLISLAYISGLIAFFFLPTQISLQQLLSLRGIDGTFFMSPLVSLSWLYGFAASAAVWIASRRNYFLNR
jgi:hypothetical protein